MALAAATAAVLAFLHAPAPALAAPAAAAPSGSCQLQRAGSGLQWCDIEEGDGPAPIKGAFYKVNYRASLGSSGGPEFDNSWAKRQPLVVKVGEREVMDAWDAAILGGQDLPPMREGGVRRILVPPGPLQAQGTKSLVWVAGLLEAPDDAGASAGQSDLAFDLELLKRRTRG